MVASFRNLFYAIAEHHDSTTINSHDFYSILKALGIPILDNEIQAIWDDIDHEEDGTLSYPEFAKVMQPLTDRFTEMIGEFESCDHEDSGRLTLPEIQSVMKEFGIDVETDVFYQMMGGKSNEENEDGTFDYRQFLKGATLHYNKYFLDLLLQPFIDAGTIEQSERPSLVIKVDEYWGPNPDHQENEEEKEDPQDAEDENGKNGNEEDDIQGDEQHALIQRKVSITDPHLVMADSDGSIEPSYSRHVKELHPLQGSGSLSKENEEGKKQKEKDREGSGCGCCPCFGSKSKKSKKSKKRRKSAHVQEAAK